MKNKLISSNSLCLSLSLSLKQHQKLNLNQSLDKKQKTDLYSHKQIQNQKQLYSRIQVQSKIISPYTSIGVLRCYFKNSKTIQGTAFLIKHNVALTCAHNIYDKNQKQFIVAAEFIPGFSCKLLKQKNCKFQIAYAYVPKQYIQMKSFFEPSNDDYALLIINTIQPLSRFYSKFDLKYNEIKEENYIALCGYPQDLNLIKNNTFIIDTLYGSRGKIKILQQKKIYYNIDTSKGQSGSPIFQCSINICRVEKKENFSNNLPNQNQSYNPQTWVKQKKIQPCQLNDYIFDTKTSYQLIGIHTGNYKNDKIYKNLKYGVRLTKGVLNRINFWMKDLSADNNEKIILNTKKIKHDYQQLQIRMNYSPFYLKLTNQKIRQDMKFYDYFQKTDTLQLSKKAFYLTFSTFDYLKAKKLYFRVYDLYQKICGEESFECGKILDYIGMYYLKNGDYKASKQCQQKSLAIKKKIKGQDDMQYSYTLHCLGNIAYEEEKYDQALRYFFKSLKIKEDKKGKQSISCANILNHIGMVYLIQKKYDQAILMFKRGLEITIKAKGINNFENMKFLNNLGQVYYFKKQNKHQGQIYLLQSHQIYQISNLKQCEDYANLLKLFGDINQKEKCLQKAKKSYQKSKIVFQNMIGKDTNNKSYKLICEKQKSLSEVLRLNKQN